MKINIFHLSIEIELISSTKLRNRTSEQFKWIAFTFFFLEKSPAEAVILALIFSTKTLIAVKFFQKQSTVRFAFVGLSTTREEGEGEGEASCFRCRQSRASNKVGARQNDRQPLNVRIEEGKREMQSQFQTTPQNRNTKGFGFDQDWISVTFRGPLKRSHIFDAVFNIVSQPQLGFNQ